VNEELKKITTALISVYHKDNLDKIVISLDKLNIKIYSTGGTRDYIKDIGIKVTSVEDITSYPSILGGRIKTLHPKIFGGILARRDRDEDLRQIDEYQIPKLDLVIVDLYPFEETLASGADEQSVIEKIDIGGVSLIRASAKNYKDILIVSSRDQYNDLLLLLEEKQGKTTLEDRKKFAAEAFSVSSHYDTAIFKYFNSSQGLLHFRESLNHSSLLRYGENPHQKGIYYGNLELVFEKLHGKEISYNNLLDIDAAINLIADFKETVFAILKHNNPCGIASRENLFDAWKDALAGDPVSAFGGILITNEEVNLSTAEEINKLFFEVILARKYSPEALELLKQKKNRIILVQKETNFPLFSYRSLLNGAIYQERDLKVESASDLKVVTKVTPTEKEKTDLLFANIIVKHTKSNSIVLARNKQLLASGVGQTSRVDALKQSIEKARSFGFDLSGAAMASDAFFPFADSVEIAHKAGITSVIQPGGSIRDKDSIEYCDEHGMSMVFTGTRHFRH
jgi:phosphoribosylaminoimidazolecarboxamide formyltransferase/IMP cyclohydrolase